jgi:hypothetical protein
MLAAPLIWSATYGDESSESSYDTVWDNTATHKAVVWVAYNGSDADLQHDYATTSFELVFYQRDDAQTFGDMTVALFNQLTMASQSSVIVSPLCGIPRWFDNHYALHLSLEQAQQVASKLYNGDVLFRLYYTTVDSMTVVFVYVVEPNGYDVEFLMSTEYYDQTALGQDYPILILPEWDPFWCDVTTGCVEETTSDEESYVSRMPSWIPFGVLLSIFLLSVMCSLKMMAPHWNKMDGIWSTKYNGYVALKGQQDHKHVYGSV